MLNLCREGDILGKIWQILSLVKCPRSGRLKACFQIDAIHKYDTNGLNILPFWSQAMDVLSSNGNHSKQISNMFPNFKSHSIRNIHIWINTLKG